MEASEEEQAPDWLGACRRITVRMREMFLAHPTTEHRAVETGRGEGGDEALVIDRAAEQIVFDELEALRDAGHRFTAISEERGTVGYGAAEPLVVIDPIDGSLNAKRGMTHFSLSIAVADGPTMADVFFGYVYDFGAREEWTARRGAGAELEGRRLDPG
ncbi:MAG: monophosphatase, partial [Solirubrobacteraceae bacterium]|nr:monophosphatase [Solirubrobacteraceae bacterium]